MSDESNTVNLTANTVNVLDATSKTAELAPLNTTSSVTVTKTTQSTNDTTKEPWFTARWRPAAAWCYLIICLFDFMIAPSAIAALNTLEKIPNTHDNTWVPLTTSGGSIFHLSFGAIIGISAYGRTREKIAYDGAPDNDTPSNKAGG